MKPEVDAYTVQIPLTFDGQQSKPGVSKERFYLSFGLLFAWFAISIVAIIFAEGLNKLWIPLITFMVLIPFIRIVVIKERYFKKKRDKLISKDFVYPQSVFWDIYEISPKHPYICRYLSGLKAIYVRFDKDVIVGKPEDNIYNHFEAISDALLQMSKRGIDCIHIDYMDSVGKDSRMVNLFDMVHETENIEIKDLLTHIFDNVEYTMKKSYTTYDVYAFFCKDKEELFWSELEIILDYFLSANYLRYTILDREEIGEVVKSVMNIDNFSVNRTSESLFIDSGMSKFLKPIWVERDNERKILNKTREELDEEQNVTMVEKDFKKSIRKNKNKTKFLKKEIEKEEIDLFNTTDYTNTDYNNRSTNNNNDDDDDDIDLFQ